MPGVDWIPGISHLKAAVQLVTGDVEGAGQTMENFCRECPVVSQVTSLVQLAAGDSDGAVETQKRCLGTINNVANGIPVVGHVKGVVHHIAGDHEGGNQALNAASRTTVVIASGAAAGLATGGLGAIPAGIAAGGAYDITASVVTDKPQGWVAAVGNAVENPSAGAIFDAAVIPVGDGLAGYSGGQIASKVSTQIKLDGLEATRAAKMNQLDAGMFGEGDAGMTSGQVHTLGGEINALTSKINAIKPQTWFDPKTGQITTTGTAPSSVAVPVVGYVDENNQETLRAAFAQQENALLSDSYIEATYHGEAKRAKTEQLNKCKSQAPRGSFTRAYPNVPFVTPEQFKRNTPPNERKIDKSIYSNYSWLRVHMPTQFNYTGVIQLNYERSGLLHSFLRHFEQWQNYIPTLSNSISRIPSSIRSIFNRIRSANSTDSSNAALNDFLEARGRLDANTLSALQENLGDIQIDLHQFIQANVTFQNYLGEGMNNAGRQQVFFRVRDSRGNEQVMVVCVSDQLFPPEGADSRPIRTIVTVFFISLNDYRNRHLTTMFR